MEALDNRQYHVCVNGSNWVTQRNHHFLWKINPLIDGLYYLKLKSPSETLETAKAESQPTHYQTEASDIVPMEVEEVESHENRDNVTAMEVDDGQNQPPSNQVSHKSTRVSWPPRDLSPRWLGMSRKLSERPSYMTTTQISCGLKGGACERMEDH